MLTAILIRLIQSSRRSPSDKGWQDDRRQTHAVRRCRANLLKQTEGIADDDILDNLPAFEGEKVNFSPGNSFAGGSDISKWPAMCTPQDYKGCDALDDRPFSNLMSASFGDQPSAFDERIHVRERFANFSYPSAASGGAFRGL